MPQAVLLFSNALFVLALCCDCIFLPDLANAQGQPSMQSIEAVLGPDGIQRATILLDSYSYAPGHIVVQSGNPVELTLHSLTFLTPHNFVLKDPTLGVDIDETVWGGGTEVVRFTPSKPGLYTFYCDKKLPFFPSHRDEGMEGTLEVK
jgi:plastocyanin